MRRAEKDDRYFPKLAPPGESADGPIQVRIIDLDDDGFGDIVTANHLSGNISVLRNKMIVSSLPGL